MKIRGGLLVALGALGCFSIGPTRASADELLYEGVGFLQGTQTFSDAFSVSSPGTLSVTLGNIAFPQALSSLQLLVSSTSGLMGTPMQQNTAGTSTATFNVSQGGEIFTQWFGTANSSGALGGLNAGVYSLEINFQPGNANTVPLPTSIALFLSGIGLLIWQRRTRTGARVHPSGDSEDMEAA
jgi:hypothetical protein